MVELVLFAISAAAAIGGAIAVIRARNPVFAAMGLLATLFALAVIYVVHLAHLVAAVQVIVYAGAVMTLFLFVIMLIGVDKREDTSEQLSFQRPVAFGMPSSTSVARSKPVARCVAAGPSVVASDASSTTPVCNGFTVAAVTYVDNPPRILARTSSGIESGALPTL